MTCNVSCWNVECSLTLFNSLSTSKTVNVKSLRKNTSSVDVQWWMLWRFICLIGGEYSRRFAHINHRHCKGIHQISDLPRHSPEFFFLLHPHIPKSLKKYQPCITTFVENTRWQLLYIWTVLYICAQPAYQKMLRKLKCNRFQGNWEPTQQWHTWQQGQWLFLPPRPLPIQNNFIFKADMSKDYRKVNRCTWLTDRVSFTCCILALTMWLYI